MPEYDGLAAALELHGNAVVAGLEATTIDPDARDGQAWIVPQGSKVEVVKPSEKDAPAPWRTRGSATFADLGSWAIYLSKYAAPGVEVFADRANAMVTAVLNAPTAEEPAWGDHRGVWTLEVHPDFSAWMGANGRLLSQEAFAELLDTLSHTIVPKFPRLADGTDDTRQAPNAATMLEVAQSLQVNTKVSFDQRVNLQSGAVTFSYREEQDARADAIEVPKRFAFAVRPWRGVDVAVLVAATLRWRVDREGGLAIGFKIERLTEHVDAAWDALVDEISVTARAATNSEAEVLSGTAPNYTV